MHTSFLTAFSLTVAFSLGTIAGSAQRQPVLTLTGKPGGAFKASGSQTTTISSIIDASSIMQITRSNIEQYSKSAQSKPLTITKQVDAASPLLYQAHNTNELIPQLSWMLYKPGDNSKYKVVTLDNVTIANLTVKKVAKDPNSKPVANQKTAKATSTPATSTAPDTEELSFNYQKISIVYFSNGSTSTADDWNSNNQ